MLRTEYTISSSCSLVYDLKNHQLWTYQAVLLYCLRWSKRDGERESSMCVAIWRKLPYASLLCKCMLQVISRRHEVPKCIRDKNRNGAAPLEHFECLRRSATAPWSVFSRRSQSNSDREAILGARYRWYRSSESSGLFNCCRDVSVQEVQD